MNNTPNTGPDHYDREKIDKTFVEGGGPASPPPPLGMPPGTRFQTSSLQSVNPYSGTGIHPATGTGAGGTGGFDPLPAGNEPVPLGSGTVVCILGSGGMAKVYKIWNEKLEVFRAVKILLPTQQAELKSRFETEAKITAKLHHPNIVEIYSVGEWNSLPYLEMEYIDGVSLEALIAQNGKLPNAVCSSIAIHIAQALEYAHSQEFLIYGKTYHGVIHRDLKPANIMISSSGEVRLMDFGIARPTEASLHTVEGNIVGTMQYLSPEQLDGVDVDARTDIYSFGAILYEMLTGTKTFPQDTITNLMKKKVLNEYRKFSDFNFSVSTHLARTSQKCLQINKNDRFPDAGSLLGALHSAHNSLSSEPPAKIIKKFLADPGGFKDVTRGLRIRISPKVLIPVAGSIGIGALVAVFLITGPVEEVADDTASNTEALVESRSEPAESPQPYEDSLSKPDPDQGRTPETEPVVAAGTKTAVTPRPPGSKIPGPKPPGPRVNGAPKQPGALNTPAAAPVLSPLEKLQGRYPGDDLLTIGKKAMLARTYGDAVLALENVPSGHPETIVKTLLLFEAYLLTGNIKEALYIANSEALNDAQFDYLCARLYERTGKEKKALELYQTALTRPSVIRSRNEIRNDALYQTAALWTKQYQAMPTPDSRIQALNAWNTVKRTYMATPEHPRFKRANSEMANIK